MSQDVHHFVNRHFRHFNAAALKDAAEGYHSLLDRGGKMFLAMGGAMSTAELGLSLAEMIRRDKVHAISCTGANLEEDLYNLIAHDRYRRVPNYRYLTAQDELKIHRDRLCRVTDTCIPEEQAMFVLQDLMLEQWKAVEAAGERKFPHQHLFDIIRAGKLDAHFQIDPRDSWMLAAAEKDLPMFVPGWEDSTSGNMYAAFCLQGEVQPGSMRTGIEYMMELAGWYEQTAEHAPVGFFQIAGGIAGDFPICVVPTLRIDLEKKQTPHWAYFCQISDSTTSYGSYSGAVPNEKITWDKLSPDTPSFVIESDATIVAPLIFQYLLDG